MFVKTTASFRKFRKFLISLNVILCDLSVQTLYLTICANKIGPQNINVENRWYRLKYRTYLISSLAAAVQNLA